MESHCEENKMENQIKNMLETVLKDDYEEDTLQEEMSTLNFDDTYITFNHRTNKKSITELQPKALYQFQNEPFSQAPIQRSQRKFHTIEINHSKKTDSSFVFQSSILGNTNLQKNIFYCNQNINIPQKNEFLSNVPETESSNYNPHLNRLINPMMSSYHFKNNFNVIENHANHFSSVILNKNKNDLEEIIEGILNKYDFINEEIYYRIQGRIYSLLKNQIGSRLFQKCLNNTPHNIRSKLLFEIIDYIPELMTDPYANYFCQKMFNYLDGDHRLIYLSKIKDYLLFIGKNRIGTYPLQSIIETLSSEDEKKVIVAGINSKDFKELCIYNLFKAKDSQGIHVVEKIVMVFEERLIPHVYDFLILNFLPFASHSNAIGVIKKMIKNLKLESTLLKVQRLILDNYFFLINNMYGNYVIQVALETWNYEFILPLINSLYGKFYEYSLNKFSSNVVEKCLEFGGNMVISKFVEEINYKTKIVDLMKNNFGNFVVQKALKMSTEKNLIKLLQLIHKNLEKIGDKKLITKWRSIVQNYDKQLSKQSSLTENTEWICTNESKQVNVNSQSYGNNCVLIFSNTSHI